MALQLWHQVCRARKSDFCCCTSFLLSRTCARDVLSRRAVSRSMQSLRHVLPVQIEGYLKLVKLVGSRRRYYRLSGAELYEHLTKNFRDSGTSHAREGTVRCVQCNASKRELAVEVTERRKPAVLVADYEIVLRSYAEQLNWYSALCNASQRELRSIYSMLVR